MGFVFVACLVAFAGLFWFSRARWLLGIRRSDLPEGSAVRRLDGLSSNLSCAVFVLVLIALAGFYLVSYGLPWLHARSHSHRALSG